MTFFYSLLCFLALTFAGMCEYTRRTIATDRFVRVLFAVWMVFNVLVAAVFFLMALEVWPI